MKIGTSNGGSQNYESQTVGYDSYKGFDEWDYVEWIGLPAASTLYVSFNESSSNNVNEWYVDDLRVELWYPEEDQNILANPNFLTGATGWSFSSTPSGEYTISSNRLNVADTSRTNDAFATQQLFATAMAEGKYRITADYAFATGGFDAGIGGNRIWTIQGTSSNTWELEAGNGNVNFRLITGQTGAGYFNSVHLYRIAEPKRNNPVPSVGVDEGVTFSGDTKINSLNYMYFPTGDTSQRGRGRVVYQLGFTQPSGGENTEMQYFDINSGGITTKFGDTVISMYNQAGGGDSTRGIWAGGYDGSSSPDTDVNTIEYITFSNTAKAIDFGDRTVAGRHPQAVSSSTRVVMGGGGNPRINTIDYITTQSTGNATNFGDLTVIRGGLCNSMMSLTRGVFAGGYGAPGANLNTIDYVTMASTGDATDFGDLLVLGANTGGGTVSSNTRGVTAMGTVTPTVSNVIEYITIATTGNALDFGDLTAARKGLAAASSTLRGVWMGGETPTYVDSIDAVTIASTGDAVDFGDVTVVHAVGNGTSRGAACSDCHGGL